jgi:hypothetical protein
LIDDFSEEDHSMTGQQELMIIVGTPAEAVDRVLDAIAVAGGGTIGNYSHCAFVSSGQGLFKPNDAANPHVGAIGQINSVDEMQIQTFCSRAAARAVVKAIRSAHPYEEPVIYLIPTLSEGDL